MAARGWVFLAGVTAVALTVAVADRAHATIRYGDIQLSGNIESQQLFRLDRTHAQQLQTFDLVQQRNTLRIQYEHDLLGRDTKLLDLIDVPFLKKANLFAYYRLVYDSAYSIEPGPRLRTSGGFVGGGFDSFSDREQAALALENRLREFFATSSSGAGR